ncbi:lipopolysaccharide biosynthesis protein [Rhodococcus jostii]|uniref:lipopolysaccharide biosynthesis protein n=1 Tax=Rhodococcus jostii TaxID=132919 RepID=UPI0036635E1A
MVKALVAAMWTYGGRALGLGWTVLVIAALGITDYGLYAMGFALAAMVAGPVDHPFNVRSVRVDDQRFERERTARILVGGTVLVLAVALTPAGYIAWFALVIAGGEIVFNAFKSQAVRDGHPDVVMRMDTLRQGASIALGATYLVGVEEPSLQLASLCYVAPYAVILALTVPKTFAAGPALPGDRREISLLVFENFSNAVYVQGDVLLLGVLTDSTVAGYYSIASLVGWAVAAVGQSYAQTYHQRLREASGAVSAGPSLRSTTVLAAAAGVVVLVVGLVLLVTPAPPPMAGAVIAMSTFVFLRAINWVFTTVLYLQERDRERVRANATVAALKMVLILTFVGLLTPGAAGAIGTALASVIAEAVLFVWFHRALYGSARSSAERS